MSGKYVPPSRRAGFKATTSELPPGHTAPGLGHRIYDVERVFDTRQQGTFNYFAWRLPQDVRRPRKERVEYDPGRTPVTTPLPPSPPPPLPPHPLGHLVAYIMLFPDAHPLWESHAELWSRTDSQLLIDDERGLKQNFDRPIPVFASTNRQLKSADFLGWWKLDKMRIIEPGSAEAIDIQTTKERQKGPNNTWYRSKSTWNEVLGAIWIKTRFVRVDTSDTRFANLPDPLNLSPGEAGKLVLSLGRMSDESAIFEEEVPSLKEGIVADRRSCCGPNRAMLLQPHDYA